MLDTTTSGNSTYAGWMSNATNTLGFPSLDRAAGFHLDFTIQVENEFTPTTIAPASVLLFLSEDVRGIELAFWQNEIGRRMTMQPAGCSRTAKRLRFPRRLA